MYFEQIPKYRDTIMESICKCDAIIDLVRPEDNPNMGAMRTPKGLVTDLLTTEIDKLINGNNCFGLGRVELKSWDKFTPAEDFHGTTLVYRTVDFNRE